MFWRKKIFHYIFYRVEYFPLRSGKRKIFSTMVSEARAPALKPDSVMRLITRRRLPGEPSRCPTVVVFFELNTHKKRPQPKLRSFSYEQNRGLSLQLLCVVCTWRVNSLHSEECFCHTFYNYF